MTYDEIRQLVGAVACDGSVAGSVADRLMLAFRDERQKAEKQQAIINWQGHELSKRMKCVQCGDEPSPTNECYTTVCPSCRRCFMCAEPMCPVCGDQEGTTQRARDLRVEVERLKAENEEAAKVIAELKDALSAWKTRMRAEDNETITNGSLILTNGIRSVAMDLDHVLGRPITLEMFRMAYLKPAVAELNRVDQ